MKRLFLICITSFFVHSLAAQTTTDTIHSEKLKEDRVISITLPASYGKEKNRKYPLLLLLDGDYLMEPFAGALKYGNYWDDLPELIVVGINQNQPFDREEESNISLQDGLPIEKGARFFDFISAELLPALQKKYAVSNFKIIAGHDVTAGFLNLFLYQDDPVFDAFISMSPDLAKDMETRIPIRLSQVKNRLYYYQSTADGDLKKTQEVIKTLDSNLKKVANTNLSYQFDDFKNASHYSLVLFSIPNALYQIFGSYQPISNTEYQEKVVKLPNDYVSYLTKKYDGIEKSYGIKMPIRVNDFKAIEAAILKNNAFSELEKLAALSKKNYPRTMLSQYQMGLFYEKTGDAKKAAKAYLSAYNQEPIGSLTKEFMLEKVEQMKLK